MAAQKTTKRMPRKPPIAKVIRIMEAGKTARDTASSIASDIALLLKARDRSSDLSKALAELEQDLGARRSPSRIQRIVEKLD